MGFGILFTGFIFTVFDLGTMYADTLSYLFMVGLCVLGWCIVCGGAYKLGAYIPELKRASVISAFSALLMLVRLVIYILKRGGVESALLIRTASILGILCALLYAAFMFYMLTGLRSIAKQTELERLAVRAERLRGFLVVFSALDIVSSLQIPVVCDYISPVRYLVYVVFELLVAQLIFRCYMWICLETDVDMKPMEKRHEKNEEGRADKK